MRKIILLLLTTICALNSNAVSFIYNGIAYNITSDISPYKVEVTTGVTYTGSITIPTSVVNDGITYVVISIGKKTFFNSTGLTSVSIPNSVTSIGDDAFVGCASLTSVTIPNSVTSIGYDVFSDCIGLITVSIPNSVTSIGSYAFEFCSSLTSMTLPNMVTSIGDHLFSGCTNLTSVTIPNSITSIGEYAFLQCTSLTSISIPNSLISIGNRAFDRCTSLTSIAIPSSVISIGEYAFMSCTSLTSINIDASNPNYSSVEGVLFNKDKTILIRCPPQKAGIYIIPNLVTSVGRYAFTDCYNLTSVTIPTSVTLIGNGAFQSCGMTSVIIPGSVTEICCSAFSRCTNLTSIHAKPTIPPILTSYCSPMSSLSPTFSYGNIACVLYVPIGSKLAYQSTDQWKDFTSIVEEVTSVPILMVNGLNISISDNKVRLTNLTLGEMVQVITLEGKMIKQTKAINQTLYIVLQKNHIYIIKVGDKRAKVIL